jgi:hypothetical protein
MLTTVVAEAVLGEGEFLIEEQTLNIEKSQMYRAGARTPIIIIIMPVTVAERSNA